MQIDAAKLGVVQPPYLKSSLHNSSLKSLTNVRPKPDVDTFEIAPKMEESFLAYGFKVDKNNQKEQHSRDPFSVYSDAQHFVFNQKLQDMGVFDGKSEEEINKIKDLIFNITSMMSCVGESPLGVPHADTGRESLTVPRYDESLYGVTSDVAKIGLESAKAALEEFGRRYLTKEQQGEFSEVIEQFYNHNSDYLKGYRAFGEDVSKFAANFQQLGLRDIYDQKGLIGVHELFENSEEEYDRMLDNENHTQKETNHYRKKISAMFQLMQQTGSDFSALWDKIKESYEEYAAETYQENDNSIKQSAGAFTHMEEYWSKLLER